MKILFSGGGTAGSVTPLIAILDEMRKQGYIKRREDVLWLGTKNGIERKILGTENLIYYPIMAGKFRRYFSVRNFIDPLFICIGFVQSFYRIIQFWPDIIVVAGGFVGVPVVFAGWLLRRKIFIHQQDIRKGLANTLMSPFANRITVTFEKSLQDFPSRKVILTGNPVRESLLKGDRERAIQFFKLEENIPTLLVIGGGTGSLMINMIVAQSVPKLVEFCQIIHITGFKDRAAKETEQLSAEFSRYHPYAFLKSELKDAFAVADLVIARAGLSTLSELSVLEKAAIIIPIPSSHQEENASFFAHYNAVKVAHENDLSAAGFVSSVKQLITDDVERESLINNIRGIIKKDATERIVGEILGCM